MKPRGILLVAIVAVGVGVYVLTTPRQDAAGTSAVLVGAGDIAGCEATSDDETAELLDGIAGIVFTVGDNAYPDGTAQQFAECYGPTWGRHLARTRPAIGNHEYATANAAGYFDYFGERAGTRGEGWYSYGAGAWHVVVLNSECDYLPDGCAADSPQLTWLREDLEQHAGRCLAAFWHSPRFSSGEHADSADVQPLWEAVAEAGAELVVSGDDHHYERFAPLDASGVPDAGGVRQFVVGTGGAGLRQVVRRRQHSELVRDDLHGVLRLALRRDGFDWAFVGSEDGAVVDHGHGRCG